MIISVVHLSLLENVVQKMKWDTRLCMSRWPRHNVIAGFVVFYEKETSRQNSLMSSILSLFVRDPLLAKSEYTLRTICRDSAYLVVKSIVLIKP